MIDWQKGTWQSEKVEQNSMWRVSFGSDWAPFRAHVEQMITNPQGVYGDLLPIFQASDVNVVNVECTLGEKGDPIPKGGPNLRGDAQALAALTSVPFHVACLANNHTADFGAEGLAETIKLLQGVGVKTTGAGLTGEEAAQPAIVNVNGVNLGIIDCAEGEENRSVDGGPGVYGIEVPLLAAQIQSLRSRVDVVIVVFHGGREHMPVPPPYVVQALRQIAEAGADAVVAHHPHVPQGIEVWHGVPIFYSQGNFLFWQNDDTLMHHAGYLVHLDFNGAKLAGFAITPYLIKPEGVQSMQGDVLASFLEDLHKVSALLADPGKVQAVWDAAVDKVGPAGFARMLKTAGQLLEENPVKGAAFSKNLFFTQAHRDFIINACSRIAKQEMGSAPLWAKELLDHWAGSKMPQ